MASDYITQKQLLAHVNIIMKHTPITGMMFSHMLLFIDVFTHVSFHHQLQNSKITGLNK